MKMTADEALRLFNLKANYTQQDLKTRYRELTKKWHPDLNLSPNAEEIMSSINTAYEILQDAVGTFSSGVLYRYKHSSFFDVVKTEEVIVQTAQHLYKHISFFDVVRET